MHYDGPGDHPTHMLSRAVRAEMDSGMATGSGGSLLVRTLQCIADLSVPCCVNSVSPSRCKKWHQHTSGIPPDSESLDHREALQVGTALADHPVLGFQHLELLVCTHDTVTVTPGRLPVAVGCSAGVGWMQRSSTGAASACQGGPPPRCFRHNSWPGIT